LLFAQSGHAGVGMRQVAERAGLSKSALFHHFPTKLSLYAAVHIRALQHIEARLESAAPCQADPMEQLEVWIDTLVDTFAERQHLAPLLLRALFEAEPLDAADLAHHTQLMGLVLGRVGDCLKEGMATGRFRQVSVKQTLQTLIGMVVYHFASGDFGDDLMGESIYAPEQVQQRKQHVIELMRRNLLTGRMMEDTWKS